MPDRSSVVNFGAGPSALPRDVLEEAARGLLDYEQSGMGITEISHRSKAFAALNSRLESLIRSNLGVPSTHHILFTQGGASLAFSSVALNLMARHRLLYPELPNEQRVADYILTGSWGKKASEEARRLGVNVNVAVDARTFSESRKSFDNIPSVEHWKLSANPAYVFYCENETVDGVQFASDAFPFSKFGTALDPPIVADYSSSFLSRPIPNIAQHAVIFAGAQKNLGPAGLTILIVRADCLVDVDAAAALGAVPVPLTLSYKTLADGQSVYNTPPMFSMYVAQLVLEHIDFKSLEEQNQRKQEKVYAALEAEPNVYRAKVMPGSRSWMNVTFEVLGEGAEQRFLAAAEEKGLLALKGHRSVGGIRASLYNAITEEETNRLVAFLQEFGSTK